MGSWTPSPPIGAPVLAIATYCSGFVFIVLLGMTEIHGSADPIRDLGIQDRLSCDLLILAGFLGRRHSEHDLGLNLLNRFDNRLQTFSILCES